MRPNFVLNTQKGLEGTEIEKFILVREGYEGWIRTFTFYPLIFIYLPYKYGTIEIESSLFNSIENQYFLMTFSRKTSSYIRLVKTRQLVPVQFYFV